MRTTPPTTVSAHPMPCEMTLRISSTMKLPSVCSSGLSPPSSEAFRVSMSASTPPKPSMQSDTSSLKPASRSGLFAASAPPTASAPLGPISRFERRSSACEAGKSRPK
eukprot:146072-Pyramimonas_sp.AAC.1